MDFEINQVGFSLHKIVSCRSVSSILRENRLLAPV
jgi:hypothetical protein